MSWHGVGNHDRDGCGVGHHPVGNIPARWRSLLTASARYVSNGGDGTVSVITTATGEVSATIPVGNYPGSVAITPDGKHAYVTNSGDGTVSVITTATGEVSATITVGTTPVGVVFTPDGKHAYVTNKRRRHGVGDHDRDECGVGPHHRRQNPAGIAITPDGKHVYVANNGDGTVSVITTATGAVSAPITVGNTPLALTITPDGKPPMSPTTATARSR